jgi:hypothetical protein
VPTFDNKEVDDSAALVIVVAARDGGEELDDALGDDLLLGGMFDNALSASITLSSIDLAIDLAIDRSRLIEGMLRACRPISEASKQKRNRDTSSGMTSDNMSLSLPIINPSSISP